jgi:hypothetical protein
MDIDSALRKWWASLTEQRAEARTIRSGPTPPPAWFTDGLTESLRRPIYAVAYLTDSPKEPAIYTIRREVLEFIAAQPEPEQDA